MILKDPWNKGRVAIKQQEKIIDYLSQNLSGSVVKLWEVAKSTSLGNPWWEYVLMPLYEYTSSLMTNKIFSLRTTTQTETILKYLQVESFIESLRYGKRVYTRNFAKLSKNSILQEILWAQVLLHRWKFQITY